MMLNRYEQEIIKLKSQRDKEASKEIGLIFDKIRMQVRVIADNIASKAEETEGYLKQYGRTEKLAKDMNETLRPNYILKDRLSRTFYEQEYVTAYMQSLYTIENLGIGLGYLAKLPNPAKKQMTDALKDPLSKLMDSPKMKTSRSVDIEQLYTTIVNGVESGLSLPSINKALDINLGYRDSNGKILKNIGDRKGQQYRTMRILRTEVLRMRSVAETDQWVSQQAIVPSELVLVEVLDDRTRSQSARMDGQVANKEGKFKFPDGNYHYAHRSGVAKWDIHDRASTVNRDPEFPPESRIERDPKTGKNKVVPYKNYEQYAKEKGLVKNRYGETLFPKK